MRDFRAEDITMAELAGYANGLEKAIENLGAAAAKVIKKEAAIHGLYNDLIMAVGNKYPKESRHETALRYIRQAEEPSQDEAKVAL